MFKRTDRHIFYLQTLNKEPTLCVYSIAGADSALLYEYTIKPASDTEQFIYETSSELYISQDGTSATVLIPTQKKEGFFTTLVKIDITDTPHEVNRAYISGEYVSSRYSNNQYLFISSFHANTNNYEEPTLFVPQTGNKTGTTCIPMDNIVIPESVFDTTYTVICTLDDNLNIKQRLALLSYSADPADIYVSQENIFATYTTYSSQGKGDEIFTGTMTNITCVSYTNELQVKGNVVVAGTIENQYCMDENDGILRVVTTSSYSIVTTDKRYNEELSTIYRQSSADLYCIDLNTFCIVSSVERFAPLGERVRSVRFTKDTAYVCTAIVTEIFIEDPVYAFDLSDINHITYKDTGTIPGYSISLSKFSYDTLLGIGVGDENSTLKIELYRETEHNVVSVAKYECTAEFSSEYKAYYIDQEKGLIGLGINTFDSFWGYLLLCFDGEKLTTVAQIDMPMEYDFTRATVIDGYLYLITADNFLTYKL